MASKLDELRRRAEQAARELNEKYDIKSRLDQGARAATDALRKGTEAASSGINVAKEEVSRIDREHKISESVSEGAKRATESARGAAATAEETFRNSGAPEKASDMASEARSKATDLFGEARKYYDNATGAARASVSAARLPSSVQGAVTSARAWVKENPGKTAIVSLALIAGARAGSAFSTLDVTLLGAGGAGNWFFHSAIVPYGLRKLSEKYEGHLKNQETLLREGRLSDSEQERVKFERDVAKYVGAPLLGAFSVAAGAGLMYEAFTGAAVTGVPISLVLGGNPMLSSIWFFANGMICFHNGYKFFMMALADQEDVARVVRDIKGLLPAEAAG
ncbi:MAG TPA: hypothetical protein VNH22_00615 [Blastocatellia bacterium]|jgi:ElaB/YqjD/DUF883 family membrane-anchored ribosome-binding protein|nr:hypothetical protein [Blastocatellia bacterium]